LWNNSGYFKVQGGWHGGGESVEEAADVVLGTGQTVVVDGALYAYASVTGRVCGAYGTTPFTNYTAEFFQSTPTGWAFVLSATATVQTDGTYFAEMPGGYTYRMRVTPETSTGLPVEWYPSASTLAEAADIPLSLEEAVSGIDVVLGPHLAEGPAMLGLRKANMARWEVQCSAKPGETVLLLTAGHPDGVWTPIYEWTASGRPETLTFTPDWAYSTNCYFRVVQGMGFLEWMVAHP